MSHEFIFPLKLRFILYFQGCARFPEISQNVSDRQILWSLCSVVFHALALKLPIQTSLSVAPELQVFLRSTENCQNFRKTSTPQSLHVRVKNVNTPAERANPRVVIDG